MNKNKYISFIIAVSLLFLTACSTSNQEMNDTETSVSSETASETYAQSEADTSIEEEEPDTSPITLSLYIADKNNSISFDNPIAEKITELTGVTLDISTPTEAGISEDISLMISTDSLPDLIYAADESENLISSGKAVTLDDYIAEYGSNLSKMYGDDIVKLKYSDGRIYTVGTVSDSSSAFKVHGTFQVQNAMLKELGYPEIKTLGQLEQCLKDYAEIKGSRAIGLSLCGGTRANWVTTVSDTMRYVLGYDGDSSYLVDGESGEAVYQWVSDGAKEYISWLNRLYNEGLLDDKSFIQKHDAYDIRLADGNVIAIADSGYSKANDALIDAGKSDRTYFPLAVTLNDDTNSLELYSPEYNIENGIIITSSCSDPIRAFRFLDMWCTDEMQTLVNWGADGVNYTYDDNGRRIFTDDELTAQEADDYSSLSGVGLYAFPFPHQYALSKDTDGNYITTDFISYQSTCTDAENETLAGYGINTAAEMFPSSSELGERKFFPVKNDDIDGSSEIGIIETSLETYVRSELPNLVTCSEDEFDEKWDAFHSWLIDNGADRLGALMTELVQTENN